LVREKTCQVLSEYLFIRFQRQIRVTDSPSQRIIHNCVLSGTHIGERRVATGEPKVRFTSSESFAKVLSAGNRELLRVIAEKTAGSLDELARIIGKAKSNLSRTLRTMEGYGLVRLERGARGRITPKVMHDRVELVPGESRDMY